MKSWEELTDAYLKFLVTTGRSRTTVGGTKLYIERFREFCQTNGALRPADVTLEHAAVYEQRLKWEPGVHGQLYSPSTVQQALLLLRLFFRWAAGELLLLTDPFRDTRLERVKHFDRRLLSIEEVGQLLSVPPLHTLVGKRDRAILETLYAAGLRREECVRLDVTDVDFELQCIVVRNGKGGRDRHQPMGSALQATLKDYLDECRPHLVYRKDDNGALFVLLPGQRLSGAILGIVVRKYAEQAGLGRVTAHQLRHAFAQHMLENGARLEEVQQLLGHAMIQSTSIYTSVTPMDVARDHKKTHPRARSRKPRKKR